MNSSVTLTKEGEEPVTLTEDTHYTVTGKDDRKFKWEFTDQDGLEALNGHPGWRVEIVLTTKVNSLGDEPDLGVIGNTEYGVSYNDNKKPGEGTPYRFFGTLELRKLGVPAGSTVVPTDKDFAAMENELPTGTTYVKGATFQVYPLTDAEECRADTPDTGLIATGTSGDGGIVVWDSPSGSTSLGLFVGESYDPFESRPQQRDYCVYETVAPAGFTAMDGPLRVTIAPGEDRAATWNIPNVQKEGPNLPLTGAAGTTLIVLARTGLIAVAVGWHLARKRRAHTA